MRKRMFVYFLVMTICLFHLLVPDVVFAQAVRVFNRYTKVFKHPDVHAHFPDVLEAFKDPNKQLFIGPGTMDRFVEEPLYLRRSFAPNAHDSILTLLLLDGEFQKLFRDDDFYDVVQNSPEINVLISRIKSLEPDRRGDLTCPAPVPPPQPESPRATMLRMVPGNNNQSGEVGKPLAQPFVVGVLDQDGKPLEGTRVTFTITAGNGRLSATRSNTDVYGQARTTLTLGPNAGRHSVRASVFGITQSQTFTATAKEPEPDVPVPPPTGEPPLPPIYWIEGNTIYRSTGGIKTIFNTPQDGTLTGGLAVDTEGGKVYWTEQTIGDMGRIQSADLNGSDVDTVKKEIAVPYYLALNAKDKKLYWTNFFQKIQSSDVDGRNFEGDFIDGLKKPRHIAFDVETRRLYWTEMDADGIWSIFNTYAPHVAEGTARPRDFEKKVNLGEVKGIAVFNDVVYWTEQKNSSGSIRSVNRNGSGDKLLATTESIPGGIAVDAVGGKVYWTTSHGIQSAPLTDETVVIRKEEPRGIALGGTAAPGAPAAPSLSPVDSVENTLLANYPNPFNPETWIPYQLSESADVSVSIYSVNGHLVRRLDLGHQSAGVYRSRGRAAYWDGRNELGERVASGLYFYTLTAGDFTATRKMLIRK